MHAMMSVNNLSSSYLQSILTSAMQGTGSTNSSSTSTESINAPSPAVPKDGSTLSPFAQMLGQLQQLQQSDPAKYQQVTQQIATNLESASQTAVVNGNTTAAAQLDKLSTDFSNASKSGQLPNIQDLAQAVAGHHHGHGHHHHVEASSDADASGSSSSNSSAAAAQSTPLSQLLAAFQSGQGSNPSLDPMSIIMSTLSQSGTGQ
jgi:hypothetical protein